jgi:hypothetical protein
MALENFTSTIMAGLDNPDCAFYVGTFFGSINIGRIILMVVLINVGYDILKKFIPWLYKEVDFKLTRRKLYKKRG